VSKEGSAPRTGLSTPTVAPARVQAPSSGKGSPAEERSAQEVTNDNYQQRKSILIQRAAELFHGKGLRDTSLSDIAGAAGLDRASFYYYFQNKEAILAEVLQFALTDSMATLGRIAEDDLSPDEKLRRLIVTAMQLFDQHYPYLYVYVSMARDDVDALPVSPELKEWLIRHSYESSRMWRDVVAEGIQTGVFSSELPISMVNSTILGAISSSHYWYRPDGKMSPEEVGNGLAKLLIDGLCSKDGSCP
jgi:TetR/AcrR family transcriptional regulator, cholesterol catabolism regulator